MLIFGCVDNTYAAHEGPVTLKKAHGTFIMSVSFRVPSQWIFDGALSLLQRSL